MKPVRRHLLLSLTLATLLAACATTPPEATVQVFTLPPALPAGATYRIDRLPSQSGQPAQAELEATADSVLAAAGLRRDDAAGRYAVQLSASEDRPPAYGWGGGPSVGIGIGGGSGGGSVGFGFGIPIGGGGPRPQQRVDVQMRDVASGQVVFQSQANGAAGARPGALLEAAMRGFPQLAPGTRTVPLAQPAPAR